MRLTGESHMDLTFSKGALPHTGNTPTYMGTSPYTLETPPTYTAVYLWQGKNRTVGNRSTMNSHGRSFWDTSILQRQDNDWQMDRPSTFEAECHIQGRAPHTEEVAVEWLGRGVPPAAVNLLGWRGVGGA